MNKEIMILPSEIEKYKNEVMPFYWKVPQRIIRMWNSYIEPTNLYGSGEKGAYAYAKSRRLSEESLIYLAIYADAEGHLEMGNGFWKLAYKISKSPGKSLSARKKKVESSTVQRFSEPRSLKASLFLQEWWYPLVREQGNYSCFVIFLALPSDKESIRYLTEFGDELEIISNATNILVVPLGNNEYLRSDMHGEGRPSAIKGDIQKGYSVQIARLFGVDFSDFPCLVVFKNLYSSEHNTVSLTDMSAEEIARRMRWIFDIVGKAVRENKSPLDMLQQHRNDERLRNAGKPIIAGIRTFVGMTIKAAIELWMSAQFAK